MGEFIEVTSVKAKKEIENLVILLERGEKTINNINSAFAKTKVPSAASKQIKKAVQETKKLSDAQKESRRITQGLNRQKAKLNVATGIQAQGLQRLKFETQKANKASKQRAIISSSLATAYDKEQAKIALLSEKYKNFATKQAMGIKLSHKEEAGLKKVTTQINRKREALKKVDSNMGVFNRNVGNYKSALSGAAGAAKNLSMQLGLMGGAFLFIKVMRDGFNRIREFDKEMQKLAGLSGEARGELSGLEHKIIDVASASISTSTQVAKLATVLIQLGKTKEEVKSMLESVNNLALGLDTTSEGAGEFLVQTLNAFGKSTESADRFADIIAKISDSTALDFQRMRDSFQYLSPIANQLGKDINDVGAIIGVLNDSGIKAQRAGRLMATSFRKLSAEGLTLEDALDRVNEAQKSGKTEMEVLTVASKIFGGQSGGLAVILANNRDKIEAYSESFRNASGSLKELTDKKLKSLDAQLKLLNSSWEAYILGANEVTGSSNNLITVISFLSKNLKNIINVIVSAAAVWLTYKTALILASLQHKLLTLKLWKTVTALNFTSVAAFRASFSMKSLNKAMKSNAIFLAIAIIAGLVYVFNKLNVSLSESVKKLKKTTDNFLDQQKEIKKVNDETLILIDRYDKLKPLAEDNEEAQSDLNEIMGKLKKTVPDAEFEFDEYGKTIGINTGKIRENIKANDDLKRQTAGTLLRENVEKFDDLMDKKEEYANLLASGDEGVQARRGTSMTHIPGVGSLFKEGKVIKKYSAFGNSDLTGEELKIVEDVLKKNKKDIVLMDNSIKELMLLLNMADEFTVEYMKQNKIMGMGELNAEDRKAIQIKRDKALLDAEDDDKTKDRIETIKDLRTNIKKLNSDLEKLAKTDKAGIKNTQDKIKAAEKELDTVLNKNTPGGNTSGGETAEEEASRLKNDSFKLNEFLLEEKIASFQAIASIEDGNFDDRKKAIKDRSFAEIELAKLTTVEKLRNSKNFSDSELKNFEKSGALSAKQIKNLTDEELLIYKQYQSDLRDIIVEGKEDRDFLALEEIEKTAKYNQNLQDTKMNDAIIAENKAFNLRKGIYADEENAVKKHEKRIAAIKKEYAIKTLETRLAVLKALAVAAGVGVEQEAKYLLQISELEKQISNLKVDGNSTDLIKSDEAERRKIISDSLSEISQYYNLDSSKFEKLFDKKENTTADYAAAAGEVLTGLGTTIFQGNIQNINNEIAASEEKYAKLIRLAEGDEKLQTLLKKESEKKKDKLLAKRAKEEKKAAIFNATIQGSVAVISAAKLGPVWLAVVAAMVAAKIALIIAQPLPTYAKGRKGGPKEYAILGDGGKREAITDKRGNITGISPKRPTVMELAAGDSVIPDITQFDIQRSAIITSMSSKGNTASQKDFDYNLVAEKMRKEIIKSLQKANFVNQNNIKIDMSYPLKKQNYC